MNESEKMLRAVIVSFPRVERVARGCDSGVKTRPKHLVFASALPFAASACYLLH